MSLLFIAVFCASMLFDAVREGPALSFFGGAITTNTPVIVVLFFVVVGLVNGLFSISYEKLGAGYRIKADTKYNLRDEANEAILTDVSVDDKSESMEDFSTRIN